MTANLHKQPGSTAWELSGQIDIHSVPGLLKQAKGLFNPPRNVVLDLKAVDRMDSAGLALLIEWLRLAKRRGASLQFRNIPSQIQAIATVCGLENLLPPSAFRV